MIFRLGVGGLENGLVNLVNTMPAERYRHAIVCLDDYTDFARRIRQPDVALHALHKRPGHDVGLYARLWRLFRKLRPAIVHTRNIGALECIPVAAAAGVRRRVHGEHGWDVGDLYGTNRRYAWLRRGLSPFVSRFVTVSEHIERWLVDDIGIASGKIVQVYNGVDTQRFAPSDGDDSRAVLPAGFAPPGTVVLGTVGRMETVKNPLGLVEAFVELVRGSPNGNDLRLVMLGDGALRDAVRKALESAGVDELAWLPGAREDVPKVLGALDVFVLPSVNEGISNTILEAMACGLPVVATAVGGNPELIVDAKTGALVAAGSRDEMVAALSAYTTDPERRRRHGGAGRRRVEETFSLAAMVNAYIRLYDALLGRGRAIARS